MLPHPEGANPSGHLDLYQSLPGSPPLRPPYPSYRWFSKFWKTRLLRDLANGRQNSSFLVIYSPLWAGIIFENANLIVPFLGLTPFKFLRQIPNTCGLQTGCWSPLPASLGCHSFLLCLFSLHTHTHTHTLRVSQFSGHTAPSPPTSGPLYKLFSNTLSFPPPFFIYELHGMPSLTCLPVSSILTPPHTQRLNCVCSCSTLHC